MNKIILVMILAMAVLFSSSNETLANQAMYGGSSTDSGQCIANTSDGGYIIAGYSWSDYIISFKTHVEGYDIYVIKFNSSGTVAWKNMYHGSVPRSIQQTSDGGYIIAVYQRNQKDDVLKLDSKGTVIWEKTYECSRINSIQQTSDGGYIAAGYLAGDYCVIKLDSSGTMIWQNMYGGSGTDYASSIQQTSDGGYIVAGSSYSTDISGVTNHGCYDYYVIKLDSDGTVVWQNMYGGSLDDSYSRNYRDRDFVSTSSIQQTSDGGYLITGTSTSTDISGVTNHGDTDIDVIKLDSSGAIEWQKMYGGSGEDSAFSFRQTLDGGYIIAGTSSSTDISGVTNIGGEDYYVIKLDSSGNIEWHKKYGGAKTKSYLHYKIVYPYPFLIPDKYTTNPSFDCAYEVVQRSNGSYIVVGESSSGDISGTTQHSNNGNTDVYVITIDKNGAL